MNKITSIIFVISLPLLGFAEFFSVEGSIFSEHPSFESEPVFENLQGILIVSDWHFVRKNLSETFYGVEAQGSSLLAEYPGFLKTLRSRYIGRPLTKEAVCKLQADIGEFYREKGQPFVIVDVPRQDPSQNLLQIVVKEASLGNVSVKGNSSVKAHTVRDFIRAQPGSPIDAVQLVQDMTRMNQNPFRRTDAIFRPGEKPGTADLELATIDRWPYRFYTGADNTGTIATERDRFFFGINLGKTIVADSEVSYQFTCSPNWNRFIAQTALCRIPFPARQTFIFFGGYSQVQPELADDLSEKSISWQVDGRYRFPLVTNTAFLQEFILGFDFKQVIARLKQHKTLVFNNIVDVDQFMLGFDLGHRSPYHKMTLIAEMYISPGGMSHANTTEKFLAFRPHSGSQYVYGKLSHSFALQFCSCWFSYDINGQLASKNLLPSEQFTLAGYNAVRGFEERIANTDNALLVNLMLESPRWSFGKLAGWSKRNFDEFYFLVFFDAGVGSNVSSAGGEISTVSLASVGPGARYQIDRHLSARFDYGFQLWHRGFFNPTQSRYNFGLNVSF